VPQAQQTLLATSNTFYLSASKSPDFVGVPGFSNTPTTLQSQVLGKESRSSTFPPGIRDLLGTKVLKIAFRPLDACGNYNFNIILKFVKRILETVNHIGMEIGTSMRNIGIIMKLRR